MLNRSSIGFGTTQFWAGRDRDAYACMRTAVREYGISVIDTAEMYGAGRCESVVGDLIRDVGRGRLYIVDKILPDNAVPGRFRKSLEGSLRRLGTDHIDLYLLHWRENADLGFVAAEMENAVAAGKILHWGVSNFDTHDSKDLLQCESGSRCSVNQIYYNMLRRGPEFDLLPLMQENGISLMSYSSLDTYSERSRLAKDPRIAGILSSEDMSIEALQLAFIRRHQGAVALFSTGSVSHLENDLQHAEQDISAYMDVIDEVCPPPDHKVPLEKR